MHCNESTVVVPLVLKPCTTQAPYPKHLCELQPNRSKPITYPNLATLDDAPPQLALENSWRGYTALRRRRAG